MNKNEERDYCVEFVRNLKNVQICGLTYEEAEKIAKGKKSARIVR